MSKKLRKTGRKSLSVFLSATTALWLVGSSFAMPFAASAQSISIAELQQQIAALTAQLAALTGSSGSTYSTVNCEFTVSLTVGSRGEDVRCLQQYLNSLKLDVANSGPGSPGNETTYFGSLTRAAVAKWQTAHGVNPPAGYFGPISRAKYRELIAMLPTPTPTPTPTGGPVPTGTGTGLTVMSGTQPAASLASQNAINVPFTRVKFTASNDGDVIVNSITVERTGLMVDAVLTGVVLLDESGNRLGLSKTLNANHQAILTEPFVVKAGQTREMTIAGDMAASLATYAGQSGFLSLVGVNTAANVTGCCVPPITGSNQTINASLNVGSVTLDNGSIEPGSSVTKEVGTTGYTFASIKATAGSNEDIEWKSVRFNQSGSAASGDLANLKVVDKNGNSYPVVVSSDGKYYTASFSPAILLKKGESNEVSIKGDIASGSARTVIFDLYRTSDVVFHGKTFGYDVAPTADDGSPTQSNHLGTFDDDVNPFYAGYSVLIGAGSLRVDKSSSVTSGFIAQGGTQQPIGAFVFEAKGEPVTFSSWILTIATTDNDSGGESAALTNVTVYDKNGNAVAGPKDLVKTAITFTDSVTVPVGTNVYTVKGNLSTTGWENNDTIAVSFIPSTKLTSVTGQSTGTTVTPSPITSVTANTQTVKAATLTVTPSSAFTARNAVVSANAIELGRLSLDASASGDDLRVTVIKATLETSAALDPDSFNGLTLKVDGVALTTGTNIQDPSGNSAGDDKLITWTLDNPLIVKKGTTVNMGIFGNVSTSVSSGDTVDFDFTGNVASDWTVTGVATGSDVVETLTGAAASTANGGVVTFKGFGSYTVGVDSSAPTESWVAAGAKGQTVNVLRFTGTTEALAVTNLRLQLDVTGSSTGADYDKIALYVGGVKIAEKVNPSFTGGVEDFSFDSGGTCYSGSGTITPTLNCLVVPKDGYTNVTVKVDVAAIGSGQAGTAGQLIGVGYDGATVAKNVAVGYDSGTSHNGSTTSDQPSNSDTSTQLVYFRSVPTIARLALAAGAVTLNGSSQTLYRFTVKADPAYDVALNRVTFRLATTAGANFSSTAEFKVLDLSNGKYLNTATGAAAAYYSAAANYDGNDKLIVRILVDNTTDYSNKQVVIPAGQTKEFELLGAATTDGTGDSVSTTMLGDAARPVNVVLTGTTANYKLLKVSLIDVEQGCSNTNICAAAAGGLYGKGSNAASSTNFIWSDFASDATTTHTVQTADWMNGFKLPGLPTSGLPSSSLTN
jgi:hypothetical protein